MRHNVRSMGGMGSRIALGLAVAMAALGITASVANAAATIQSDPEAYAYLPGPYVQGLGETAIFDNSLSPALHDVTTDQLGPDGGPLFFASVVPGGQVTSVKGTEYLKAGTYPFYCTLHGSSMSGELTIQPTGKAKPRPSVKASFVNQKLKQVRKSGVRVKVRSGTASKGVALIARKGKAVLGIKRGLSFKAGQTKTMTVPLTKSGRKAVSKGKVVQISIQATVQFGKPSSATRKVR